MLPNMASPSDPQVPQTGAGDLGLRLARHDQRLRLLIQHLTGHALRQRLDFEDLVQEVYLRAVSAGAGLPQPDPPADLPLWHFLIRLARNTVIDAARSIRAAKRAGKEMPLAHADWSGAGPRASQILAQTRGPLTRAEGQETSRQMRESFDSLSSEHRRVLGLRQFEGLSARESAARMGRSEAAIHSLFRRALVAWQTSIEDKNTI
jgi:RNA polymerase sigma factor (sigma-70 family)